MHNDNILSMVPDILLTILKTVAFNILSVTRLILALTFTASQLSREDGH